MDPVLPTRHFVDRLPNAHPLNTGLNEGGRLGPNDVRSQQSPRLRISQQLDAVPLVLHGPAIGDVRVLLKVRRVKSVGLQQFLLRGTNRRHLRIRKHRVRHEAMIRTSQIVRMQQVVTDHTRLMIGHVFELPGGAHVA